MATFTTTIPANVGIKTGLTQRGRSGLEILGSMQKFASTRLRDQARTNFRESAEGATLEAEHAAAKGEPATATRDRVKQGKALAESDHMFRLERFCQRYVALQIFARGIPAAEERRPQFAAFLARTPSNDQSVQLDPAIDIPKYYETEWHLEPGGWEGYDLYSPMFSFGVGPYVFRHGGYAAVNVGDDLSESRRAALRRLPRQDYRRIYEPGCGTGTTLAMIHEAFPEAELVACDLSPQVLNTCSRVAEKFGFRAELKQRDAVRSGEPDESFDAVFSYALHHEMPPKETIKLFAEMLRILRPGGDIMLVDPPPFREVELFHAVILDWDTANRGEPFFSLSSLANWDEELVKTGFEAVDSFPLGPNGYPWVIRARKPALAEHAQAA